MFCSRFNAFLNQQRESKIITLKEEGNSNLWSYFTHCAALCVLLSIGICNAPLIHDYTIVYKGSLDDVTLICIIAGILHLFFWIVIWLFLTIKQKWIFKLRITVSLIFLNCLKIYTVYWDKTSFNLILKIQRLEIIVK